jgi:pyruvate formate lyase activating enzyme
VYAGNLPGSVGDLEHTRCTSCNETLIERSGYRIRDYRITPNGCCPSCGTAVPGRFDARFAGQLASQPAVIRLRR